jgi:4-hydroxymandelate oxidase
VTPDTRAVEEVAASAGSLREIEELAREMLPPLAYEYIDSGAADEITVRRNSEAFGELRLRPRIADSPRPLDLSLTLFGEPLPHPILLAPTAWQRVVHPEGEIASAVGAGESGAVFVVGTATTVELPVIAASATAPLWFQLYMQSDRIVTLHLVRLAEANGCRALCLTVDTARLGARNRQERSGFRLPPGVTTPYLHDLNAGRRALMGVEPLALTWREVEWLKEVTSLPVLLKGILVPDDARRAVDAGIDGLIISNHGGRNLDTVPATIEALPAVARAVGGRIPLLLDGGVRRGTDVLKALGLGASAVMIGRPYLYGLGLAGAAGVRQVVQLLAAEMREAMEICGAAAIAEIEGRVLLESDDG